MTAASKSSANNVVLVHGGFVDGSGWEGVTLRKDRFAVSIVQNPTTSLADDVAVTRRVLAAQDGPVILVGHSYGGAARRFRPSWRLRTAISPWTGKSSPPLSQPM